jgi:Lysine-specific metallo-endopeptidase
MAWAQLNTFLARALADNRGFKEGSSSLKLLIDELRKNPTPTAAAVELVLAGIPLDKQRQYAGAIRFLRRNFPDLDREVVGGFVLLGFKSIDDAQNRKNRALVSVQAVYRLAKICEATLSKVQVNVPMAKPQAQWTKEQDRATNLFKKWFDNDRRDMYRNPVRAVFTDMKAALENPNFELVVYATPEEDDVANRGWHLTPGNAGLQNAFAFVRKGENAYRVYFARAFFLEGDTRIDIARPIQGMAARDDAEWDAQKRQKIALDASVITLLHELTHITMIGDTADEPPDPYNAAVCKANAINQPQIAYNNAENYALFAKELLESELFRIDT